MKCDEVKQQGRKENSMKHSVLAAMLALGSVQAVQAETVQAETETSKPETFMDQFSVHGTLTLSSDYRSRGFSKSDQKLSVQGGLILAHQSGAYLMLWGASATTPNEGSIEADAILGYTWRIDDKNSLDFFYADVNYPGGNFSPNGKSADFGEYGVMYKRVGTFAAKDNFNAAVYYSPNYLFGSGNEYYFSSEYSFPVVENVQLFGSAGYTKQDSATLQVKCVGFGCCFQHAGCIAQQTDFECIDQCLCNLVLDDENVIERAIPGLRPDMRIL